MEKPHIWRFKTVNELRDLYSNDLNYFHLPSLKIAPFIIQLFNKAPTSGGVIGTLIQDGRYVINSNEH